MLPAVAAAVSVLAALLSGRDEGDQEILRELGLGPQNLPEPPGIKGQLRLPIIRADRPPDAPWRGREPVLPGENPNKLGVLQLMEVLSDKSLYVVYIGDGYVVDAWEGDPDEDVKAAVSHLEDDNTEVTVVRYDGLPTWIHQRFLPESQGGRWDWDDGYDAQGGLSRAENLYGIHSQEVYEYNMTRDRPYEEWSQEEQNSYKEQVFWDSRKAAPDLHGKTIFFQTGFPDDWKDAVGQLLDHNLGSPGLAGVQWTGHALAEWPARHPRRHWSQLDKLKKLDFDSMGSGPDRAPTHVVELLLEGNVGERGAQTLFRPAEDKYKSLPTVLEADLELDNVLKWPEEIVRALDDHGNGSPLVVEADEDEQVVVIPWSDSLKIRVVAVHSISGDDEDDEDEDDDLDQEE
jgi:hypothetical protein